MPKVRNVHAVTALGPVQVPVGGSDSQPLFTTAHPGSGAPILGIVMDLSFLGVVQINSTTSLNRLNGPNALGIFTHSGGPKGHGVYEGI